MSKISPTTPTFRSRLIRQSREHQDRDGNVTYEHNSYLEPGEIVVGAHSDTEITVVKARYRNPLNRQELVTVRRGDGSETELPASAARRHNLA